MAPSGFTDKLRGCVNLAASSSSSSRSYDVDARAKGANMCGVQTGRLKVFAAGVKIGAIIGYCARDNPPLGVRGLNEAGKTVLSPFSCGANFSSAAFS